MVAGFTGAELDLGAPDGPANLARRLGQPVVLAQQVHGVALSWVRQRPVFQVDDAGPCDAMATHLTGVALAVRTADCVPILLADRSAGLIAAVHAGWRGVIDRIVPKVTQQLRAAGAANLRAGIGPAICAQCYPVSPALAQRFGKAGLPVSRSRQGEPSVDLPAGVSQQLRQSGVAEVVVDGRCTRCSPGLFSFRGQGQAAGRQCGWIYRLD